MDESRREAHGLAVLTFEKLTLEPVSDPGDETTRTRKTYDVIAPRFLARTSDRKPMQWALGDFASRLAPGALVLDIGAGPGTDSAELRKHGLRAVSVDLSLGMLAAGRELLPGPRVQADMRRLPFGPVADGIWSNASLLHLRRAQVPVALREFAGVLRRPGLLYVSVKHGLNEGWEEERYGPGHPRFFTYWEAEPFDAALREAGFGIETSQLVTGTRDSWLQRVARLG